MAWPRRLLGCTFIMTNGHNTYKPVFSSGGEKQERETEGGEETRSTT